MSEPGRRKKKTDVRDNLRTSQQQGAYSQLIGKELSILSTRNKMDIQRMEPLFALNNRYMGVFKKKDTNNRMVKIGQSILFVDTSKIDPTLEDSKRRTQPLPFETKQQKYDYCNKDSKDKAFTREKFLSQTLNKDVYRFPLKSSDTYGWHKPIDRFVDNGYGRKNLEGGGFMSVSNFRQQGQAGSEKA